MSEKLKPCPFCGAQVKVWETGFGVVQVISCESCHVRFVFRWFDSGIELAKHWNRRTN